MDASSIEPHALQAVAISHVSVPSIGTRGPVFIIPLCRCVLGRPTCSHIVWCHRANIDSFENEVRRQSWKSEEREGKSITWLSLVS